MTNEQKMLNVKTFKTKKSKSKDSEFQSYVYIKNELKKIGWNIKNPNRCPDGQLYTQHECLKNIHIKSVLNQNHPEYIVKLLEDTFWIIEAKPTWDELDDAYDQAIKNYAKPINKHEFIRAKIVSGVAGNDIDRYVVKSGFWNEEKKEFEPIISNGIEITSLIKPKIAERLLEQNSPILAEYELDEDELFRIAQEINDVLHSSSVRKDKRATIVATILLSLLGKTEPNYNDTPTVFIKDINNRAQEMLEKNGKGKFFEYITIPLPEKPDAQKKFKESLVSTFFLLKKINIKSAMETGSDILGKFYESFLKYGNGAKDLGIVFTPRHLTKFATEILDINHRDIIYDPTCGTGGFLVSAFYHVKRNSTPSQLEEFRKNRLFGIDQQSSVATLAIINMIFRGDGRTNIINDDCLTKALIPLSNNGISSAECVSKKDVNAETPRPVTKVLMNPPFSLKKEEEKVHKFITHALEQMDDGGLLFSVLPVSTMIKGGSAKKWRKDVLLKNNTLLSVVTFPIDVFYPSSASITIGIFIKKGKKHPEEQNILWLRAVHDGMAKKKGKRLPFSNIPNDLEKIKPVLQSFINNPLISVENIPEFQKACPMCSLQDKHFELVPEAYLDSKIPISDEVKESMDDLMRESVAYLIRSGKEGEIDNGNY